MKNFQLAIFVISMFIFSCNEEKKTVVEVPIVESENMSLFPLETGDLMFQDSDCGPFCESIEKVTFGYRGAKLSHVGMILKYETGEINVVEAITEGVVITPLDTFLQRSLDTQGKPKVMVGRVHEELQKLVPDAAQFAMESKGKAYDEAFDMTNNKYYCSELIYDAFRHANKGTPVFRLFPMTFNDPETNQTFPIWKEYFEKLNIPIPEGQPGLNPGGLSTSQFVDIVHIYGHPDGFSIKKKN